jgi:HlyD family secretion protein
MSKKLLTTVVAFVLFLSSCSIIGTKNEITASGTIETTEINVASKANGQIKRIYVQEGSQVRQNELIAEIDHSTLDLQLTQLKSGQDLAQAQFDLMQSGARDEDIQQAEQEIKKAEVNTKLAADDLVRIKELYDTKSATKKQLDDVEARNTIAQAQYQSALQTVKKLKQWTRPEDLRAAQARLDQSKSSVAILEKAIDDCFVRTPVSGTVTNKPVETGELITQGTIIATVSKLDKVHLVIYVTERDLGKIKLNQEAGIKIDSHPKDTFIGKVIYISPKAEFTPKNIQTKEERVKLVFRIKIEIDNANGILKPGMPADAVLKIS